MRPVRKSLDLDQRSNFTFRGAIEDKTSGPNILYIKLPQHGQSEVVQVTDFTAADLPVLCRVCRL